MDVVEVANETFVEEIAGKDIHKIGVKFAIVWQRGQTMDRQNQLLVDDTPVRGK